ncbi:thioesterase family protein [Phenylobacterium terrae]|uniref:Thioesterase family protein n=1 Tax=Phenylobacterium terrae TaxID=2665495 RepID=A0ABW4N1G8_9CAUL
MAAVEVWGGGVNTWECDRMGHMNVRYYVAKAMDGLAGLAAELGMPRVFAPGAQATLVVREHHIRFLREAHPGSFLFMTGGVLEMGECEARLLLTLFHPNGEPCATFNTVVAHVTAEEGRPFPWPQRIRERAKALQVELEDYAAPRSIRLDPVVSAASLQRAEALNLRRAGRGVFDVRDCDAFGRMRPELFMSKLSDGISQVFGGATSQLVANGAPEGARIGGAALEYRLLYFGWPRAGDRYVLRSGLSDCDERVRRLIHWLLDPETGRPWGVAEAIVISLDLDARKVIKMPPEAQAAIRREAYAELTL